MKVMLGKFADTVVRKDPTIYHTHKMVSLADRPKRREDLFTLLDSARSTGTEFACSVQ
jgi:hypothetical protein